MTTAVHLVTLLVDHAEPQLGNISQYLQTVSAINSIWPTKMKNKTVFLLIAFAYFCYAQTAKAADPTCQNASVFSGKLFTDICWDCIFPIRVAGFDMFKGKGGRSAPAKASEKKVACACIDALGVPELGIPIGMWQPARIIELVRWPGCAMSLGGITLPISDARFLGTAEQTSYQPDDRAFYHVHSYAFPLLYMLDLFNDGSCLGDGFLDFDIMEMSEFDPTWNNDELGFFQQPESVIVSNPIAQAACMVDAAASTAGTPIDEMFWCAGTWGSIYPMSGHTRAHGSLANNTSTLATRHLAVTHRRGLNWRTMGDDAMCDGGGVIDPMIVKSQYRMSMFFPLAETENNHVIGSSTFTWGEWRKIPATGEDATYILWRWNDCCSTF